MNGQNTRLIVMENCQPENGEAYASSNSSVNYSKKKKVSAGDGQTLQNARENSTVNHINLHGSSNSMQETLGKFSQTFKL